MAPLRPSIKIQLGYVNRALVALRDEQGRSGQGARKVVVRVTRLNETNAGRAVNQLVQLGFLRNPNKYFAVIKNGEVTEAMLKSLPQTYR